MAAWVLIVIAGLAGLNALACSHADAALRFADGGPRTTTPERPGFRSGIKVLVTGVKIPQPPSHRRRSGLVPDCRALSVPGPSGISLASWYCNGGNGTPLFVLFRWLFRREDFTLGGGGAFLDLGMSVMPVGFTGSGGSSETYATVGAHEAEDAAAVRYARAKPIAWQRLPRRNAFESFIEST